jgi:hypothetical protein
MFHLAADTAPVAPSPNKIKLHTILRKVKADLAYIFLLDLNHPSHVQMEHTIKTPAKKIKASKNRMNCHMRTSGSLASSG